MKAIPRFSLSRFKMSPEGNHFTTSSNWTKLPLTKCFVKISSVYFKLTMQKREKNLSLTPNPATKYLTAIIADGFQAC